jgi:putative pyruvate formate lyase activating enzyme
MLCAEPTSECFRAGTRALLASERAEIARAMLADCRLCAHDCRVNRLAGQHGLCHAGAQARFFSEQVEVSNELDIIPTFAVALSGCDLRCAFCITGESSWNPLAGEPFDASAMAAKACEALQNGARTVMLFGGEPTIHLPAALDFVAAMPQEARLVWKTNAHGSAQARELLEGMFDIWVADFKFGNNTCTQRLARISDYVRVVRENLIWADQHTDLIVRHLLMPGHVECCWLPVAEWLGKSLPGMKVNLGAGFWPAWHVSAHRELGRTVSEAEMSRAREIALAHHLNLIA